MCIFGEGELGRRDGSRSFGRQGDGIRNPPASEAVAGSSDMERGPFSPSRELLGRRGDPSASGDGGGSYTARGTLAFVTGASGKAAGASEEPSGTGNRAGYKGEPLATNPPSG